MSYRSVVTMIHGLLFGGFFLLAAFALLVETARLWHPHGGLPFTERGRRLEGMYLALTATLGWLAVFSGTYVVYPWYRAAAPSGADLQAYPRVLLLASATTAPLHTLGMEWKEHVAFLAPILFTALAWILFSHPAPSRRPEIRRVLLVFGLVAFLSAAVPGAVGALLNKTAPVEGPRVIPTVQAKLR